MNNKYIDILSFLAIVGIIGFVYSLWWLINVALLFVAAIVFALLRKKKN